jgi:hypothetical protein
MRGSLRWIAAAVIVGGALAAVVLLSGSSREAESPSAWAKAGRLAHESLRERDREGEGQGESEDENQGNADRAYPAAEVTIGNVERAIAADAKVEAKSSKLTSKWDSLGPDTLDVDRLGTQSFIKPTQWSGRVTALAVDPKCKQQECTLYVAAAGGGIWRSTNALAAHPSWKHVSDGIPTNAIGSIAVDPNDPTGRTIYVGTGEGNGSGDSEAGLGLYKTTDGGNHWSLVEGSYPITNLRAITWVAVDPGNPDHIVLTTRAGARGLSSNAQSTGTLATAPLGVYNSTDGGATWTPVRTATAGATEVKFDPTDPATLYAAVSGVGLVRSTAGGAAGTWETIFALNRARFSFAPVALPSGKTRIYLANASAGNTAATAADVFRVDDAGQPAAAMTASGNAAWTKLSNPTDGTPGFAVYNFCNTPLVGSQCNYDMYVQAPADRPDTVIVGGLMHYEELKPYVLQAATVVGQRSNGRAVLESTDAGATWTDMTGDVGGESMHPDQHALAFVPGKPDIFFAGSDGGVIRSSGEFADASAQCDDRPVPLSPASLAECHNWLKRIPTRLDVMNAGIGSLQMNSISVDPRSPEDTAMAGTQDNGTVVFSGKPTWNLPLTGDGGDSGFDAVDPNLWFHTYFTGQMDVNYNRSDPTSWLWIGDWFITGFNESIRFYPPTLADPFKTKTIFVGAQRVWRTTTAGGDRAFLEAHCNTAYGEFPSDLLFTGACGSKEEWPPLGSATLTGTTFGATKSGTNITALARARDAGTMWAGTGAGRILVSQNSTAADPASVTFTRIDTPAQPGRVVSSIYADPTDANHAVVTFSGYEANTPATPGHVFDVVYDPSTKTATWKDISNNIGDQPVNDAVLDVATGDVYVSTDFSVYRLVAGTQTWIPAADGLPTVTVNGLTLATTTKGDRLLYAATHGRSAYRLTIKK